MKKTSYSTYNQVIVDALIDMRENFGISQRKLSDKLGKAHSYVAKYELGGRKIHFVEFYKICLACEASPQKETTRILKAFLKLKGD